MWAARIGSIEKKITLNYIKRIIDNVWLGGSVLGR